MFLGVEEEGELMETDRVLASMARCSLGSLRAKKEGSRGSMEQGKRQQGRLETREGQPRKPEARDTCAQGAGGCRQGI